MEKQENKYTNSAVLIDSNGVTAYFYDKIHLVPLVNMFLKKDFIFYR